MQVKYEKEYLLMATAKRGLVRVTLGVSQGPIGRPKKNGRLGDSFSRLSHLI